MGMGNFQIKNGVLKKYTGPGGDVTIPEGVTEIGWDAFAACSKLKNVIIPAGVTKIGEGAFSRCSRLKSVSIPEGVTEICGSRDWYFGGAFENCSSLTNVTIPNGVIKIGASAFCGCKSLTSVTIPASMIRIESDAFEDCAALTDIHCADLSLLPAKLKPCCVLGLAQDNEDPNSGRGKTHIKWLKTYCVKIIDFVFAHKEILAYMLEYSLLNAKNYVIYEEYAQAHNDEEVLGYLAEYRKMKLSEKDFIKLNGKK